MYIHKFMLLTGKYLPDEYIEFNGVEYFFNRYVGNKKVHHENSKGYWYKREYENGQCVYFETSKGNWFKQIFKDNFKVYYENSNGYWERNEYNENNQRVYFESSTGNWEKLENGKIIDSGNYNDK